MALSTRHLVDHVGRILELESLRILELESVKLP
jgi:hypothetical protein